MLAAGSWRPVQDSYVGFYSTSSTLVWVRTKLQCCGRHPALFMYLKICPQWLQTTCPNIPCHDSPEPGEAVIISNLSGSTSVCLSSWGWCWRSHHLPASVSLLSSHTLRNVPNRKKWKCFIFLSSSHHNTTFICIQFDLKIHTILQIIVEYIRGWSGYSENY